MALCVPSKVPHFSNELFGVLIISQISHYFDHQVGQRATSVCNQVMCVIGYTSCMTVTLGLNLEIKFNFHVQTKGDSMIDFWFKWISHRQIPFQQGVHSLSALHINNFTFRPIITLLSLAGNEKNFGSLLFLILSYNDLL